MQTSDLSGDPIQPSAKEEVTIRLPSGERRRLIVTASEAHDLSLAGIGVSGSRRRLLQMANRNWKTFVWWVFALIVASILVPAATRQWSDRQAALTLKASIATDVSKSSSSAVFAAQEVQRMGSGDVQAAAREKALNDWRAGEAAVDPLMGAYFERDSDPRLLWGGYRDAIYLYIALACCDEDRIGDLVAIQEFMDTPALSPRNRPPVADRDPWAILQSDPETSRAFRDTYKWLGLELLRYRGLLLRQLRDTCVSGYSDCPRDYGRDVIPGW